MDTPRRHPATITQEAAHWHALQRAGALGPVLQSRFMDWLVASPDHLREYLAVSRVAGELGAAMRGMAIDVDALLDAPSIAHDSSNVVPLPAMRVARDAGSASQSAASRAAPARRRRRAPLKRIATAAAIVLCLGIGTQLATPRTAHYVAVHGAPRSFALGDGTVVHLNAESALTTRFGLLQRRVELERGQASFIVATSRRPFSVHAAGLQVRDIGTTFDVSLQDGQARIGVAEGRVRIVGDAGKGRLLADLQAGQVARVAYRDHATSVASADVDTMTAWWQRRIVFRDEPLREVAAQFNRLNTLRLHVDDAAGALRITGNLDGDDVGSLRAFLEQQPMLVTVAGVDGISVRARNTPGLARSR